MAQGPPSSDSEDTGDIAVYQYESEGEEALGRSVRALFDEAGQDYRLVRAAILAYTRTDLTYSSPSRNSAQPNVTPPSSPAISSRTPAPRTFLRARSQLPTNQIAGTGPITPSPTPGRPSDARVVTDSPSRKSGPGAGSTNRDRALNNQRSRSTQLASSTQRPRDLTLLYPLLAENDMLRYFKIDDGVSYRSRDSVQELLTRIKQDEHWLGEPSHVDTSAAGSNDAILIHQPSEHATSASWYSVTARTQVSVFTSWEVAAAYTQGISKSVYRLWPTRMEAYRSFQLALVLGTLQLLPSP